MGILGPVLALHEARVRWGAQAARRAVRAGGAHNKAGGRQQRYTRRHAHEPDCFSNEREQVAACWLAGRQQQFSSKGIVLSCETRRAASTLAGCSPIPAPVQGGCAALFLDHTIRTEVTPPVRGAHTYMQRMHTLPSHSVQTWGQVGPGWLPLGGPMICLCNIV